MKIILSTGLLFAVLYLAVPVPSRLAADEKPQPAQMSADFLGEPKTIGDMRIGDKFWVPAHCLEVDSYAKCWLDPSQKLDEKIETLTRLRDHLDGCIGCGCLSLEKCALYNPQDRARIHGTGPLPHPATQRDCGKVAGWGSGPQVDVAIPLFYRIALSRHTNPICSPVILAVVVTRVRCRGWGRRGRPWPSG